MRYEIVPLVALAMVQVLEPKIPALASTRGRMFWIVLKLVLGFVLIGYTGGIDSRYWLVLLLPVVSAATTFGVLGTLVFTAAGRRRLPVVLPAVRRGNGAGHRSIWCCASSSWRWSGNLANTLAEDLRVQSAKHRRTAEQLAEANAHIQQARRSRAPLRPPGRAGPAFRRPGARAAQSAGHHQGLGGNAEPQRRRGKRSGARSGRLHRLAKWTAPTRWSPASCNSRGRSSCACETADLAQTLDRAVALVEREAPGIAIYKNYAPEIPPFPFDAELMERVFYNLVLNAAQATAPGGAVTVKTRAAGGTAEIAVIDRGAGIDPKHRDTIFNPFFTTKPEGVGLGLAIVSKIVDEHGGKITVESEPGKGSVFRVLLPMDRRADPA